MVGSSVPFWSFHKLDDAQQSNALGHGLAFHSSPRPHEGTKS
jgi:hypothetical protein